MIAFLEKVRLFFWKIGQPLTRIPTCPNATVSDLFIWRNTENLTTYFELLSLPFILDEIFPTPIFATLVIFNRHGEFLSEETIQLMPTLRQTISLSDYLPDNCGSYGTFSIFHPCELRTFDLYDSFFYDIPKSTHESFIYESKNYLGYSFSVGKEEIVEELEKQLSFIQEQIDSIERHHPLFPNGSVIASTNSSDNRKYLLQSNRKRLIINTEIFYLIKTRLKITKPNSEFIIFIPSEGINEILDGPSITNPDEIFVGNEIINTYYG